MVFDFDNTISNDTYHYKYMLEEARKIEGLVLPKFGEISWYDYLELCFKELLKNGTDMETLRKECIKTEISPRFKELF
jgi:hypothetical protein